MVGRPKDPDFVKPTVFKPSKGPPPQPFIEDSEDLLQCDRFEGKPDNIPDDYYTPEQLFRLLFNDKIVNIIVKATNQNTERKRKADSDMAASKET